MQDCDFTKLIFPIKMEDFFAHYWETLPLIVTERENPYGNLLTLGDVDFLLSSLTSPTPEWITIINNKKILRIESFLTNQSQNSHRKLLNKERIIAGFREGNTLVLNSLQHRSKNIRALCASLEETFGHVMSANMYLTPANAQGFQAHFDPHDVFILQLEGEKLWKIYERHIDFPIANEDVPYTDPLNSPIHEIYLHPGDFLYIPRGYVHEAITTKTYSMHLTIGIQALTWLDLIKDIAFVQTKFRRALPPALLLASNNNSLSENQHDFLATLFQAKESVEQGLAKLRHRFAQSRIPSFDAHFADFYKYEEFDPNMLFEKRKGLTFRFVTHNEKLILYFGECGISMPIQAKSAIKHILDRTTFSIASLPNEFSPSTKLTLIRRLVKSGLIIPAVGVSEN